jgi:hypothetical protein
VLGNLVSKVECQQGKKRKVRSLKDVRLRLTTNRYWPSGDGTLWRGPSPSSWDFTSSTKDRVSSGFRLYIQMEFRPLKYNHERARPKVGTEACLQMRDEGVSSRAQIKPVRAIPLLVIQHSPRCTNIGFRTRTRATRVLSSCGNASLSTNKSCWALRPKPPVVGLVRCTSAVGPPAE